MPRKTRELRDGPRAPRAAAGGGQPPEGVEELGSGSSSLLGALCSWVACTGLLVGCVGQQAVPTAPEPPKPAPSQPASPTSAPPPGGTQAPAPGAPSGPASVPNAQAAQRSANTAIELLESGHEDQAVGELQRALAADPNNRLAQSLMRQVQQDPVSALGREYFMYRVQPGESISRIAQRFLGDVHLFYILARYNDLKVPKQLPSGAMIKVPGKEPPRAAPAPQPSPPPPAPPSQVAQPAPPPPAPVAAPAPPVPDEAAQRRAKVAQHTRAARTAYARQDLVAAIQNWDVVLELDPGNNNAKIERQRAVDLKDKLDKLPRK
jgi:LysM domain-containing protein